MFYLKDFRLLWLSFLSLFKPGDPSFVFDVLEGKNAFVEKFIGIFFSFLLEVFVLFKSPAWSSLIFVSSFDSTILSSTLLQGVRVVFCLHEFFECYSPNFSSKYFCISISLELDFFNLGTSSGFHGLFTFLTKDLLENDTFIVLLCKFFDFFLLSSKILKPSQPFDKFADYFEQSFNPLDFFFWL